MSVCKVSCPEYNNCKEQNLYQHCIYDLGMFNSKEDKDNSNDFIEKTTY